MARRFTAQRATIDNQLRVLLKRMNAEALRVEEDFGTPGSTVSFRRGARWYTFTCAKYAHPLDNYRAVQLTIDYLYRALELYGVTREEAEQTPLHRRKESQQRADEHFETLFLPFSATPTDLPKLRLGDGNAPWWEILGTARDATPHAIRLASLALARLQHSDSGGDIATMQRINRAYTEALRERGGGMTEQELAAIRQRVELRRASGWITVPDQDIAGCWPRLPRNLVGLSPCRRSSPTIGV